MRRTRRRTSSSQSRPASSCARSWRRCWRSLAARSCPVGRRGGGVSAGGAPRRRARGSPHLDSRAGAGQMTKETVDGATRETVRTFSMANSSSALTLISRAFSSASCLMKAVCGHGKDERVRLVSILARSTRAAHHRRPNEAARRADATSESRRREARTILRISLTTSSSVSPGICEEWSRVVGQRGAVRTRSRGCGRGGGGASGGGRGVRAGSPGAWLGAGGLSGCSRGAERHCEPAGASGRGRGRR